MPLSTPEERSRRAADAALRMTPEHRSRRARAAALSRHHKADPEAAAPERARLKADAAARYVQQLVDDWPPLSTQQRARLAVLLLADRTGDDATGAGGGGGDAAP